ncbi:hypothetical protein N0B16_09025 [Chryseobacterium sp. GMJ5]|uniref:Uncharacterized protein n=1 Tax=Chryseobacterium gilvum TaxID=2976534 RepID=A0ABT2VX61_9FLAO|nr:hypothetical protein [Chryseobacterium gilvum]MCU7614575.1 hypothetical protein [Chryseobacterium gilvum]
MKICIIILLCIFTCSFNAQTLVKPADFKVSGLATHLKNKGYEILEQTETFIKIANTDKATLFIDIDAGKKYLNMNVNILLNKGISRDKIDHLINEINTLEMIKADYLPEQNAVGFQYYFWMTHGFTYETLDDAILEFFLYQGDAYELDKEKIFDYK